MSIQQMTRAWQLDLPMAEKMVLLKLADCADDRGSNAWPSVERLAKRCSVSVRKVQYVLRTLRTAGLIEVQAAPTHRRPTTYRLRLERGKLLIDDDDPVAEIRGAHPAPQRDQGCTSFAPQGCTSFAPDPSFNRPLKPVDAVAPTAAHASRFNPTAMLTTFDQLHQARFNGEKATIVEGRDARLLRVLTERHGEALVVERMRLFFELVGDKWLESRGYTVAMFTQLFPRFAAGRAGAASHDSLEGRRVVVACDGGCGGELVGVIVNGDAQYEPCNKCVKERAS